MNQNNRRPLGDLIENLNWIIKYCNGLNNYMDYFNNDYETFLENEMFQDCCLSKISQLSECLNRIDKKHSGVYDDYFVPIIGEFHGMRDITVHQYENIDFHIIWIFMTKEMPLIRNAAKKCLDEIEDSGGEIISNNRRSWFRRKQH